MKKIISYLYNFLLTLPARITPAFIKRRSDPERYSVDNFVYNWVAPEITESDIVLDAGAGTGQFKNVFKHATYEATDFEDVFHETARPHLDFYCSLDAIPKEDERYSVVLNTQVLEHVEHPQKVIDELYRVLKPGGRLYLTTNQMFPVHHAPFNFFFFTRFGLESLFKNAGFTDISIMPRGGVFWLLAKIFHALPQYVYYQACYTGYKKHTRFRPTLRRPVLAIILLPIYIPAILLISYILPFIFFYLDKLDKQNDFTLGYACRAIKPKK